MCSAMVVDHSPPPARSGPAALQGLPGKPGHLDDRAVQRVGDLGRGQAVVQGQHERGALANRQPAQAILQLVAARDRPRPAATDRPRARRRAWFADAYRRKASSLAWRAAGDPASEEAFRRYAKGLLARRIAGGSPG